MDDEYDDEANADLSLEIVAKAQRRKLEKKELSRSPPQAHAFYVIDEELSSEEEDKDCSTSVGEKRLSPHTDDQGGESVKRRKVEARGTDSVMTPETAGNSLQKSKKKKNKQKGIKSEQQVDEPEIIFLETEKESSSLEEGQSSPVKHETPPADDGETLPADDGETPPADDGLGDVDKETARKIKRKPRYFDHPEELEAASKCFKCGESGHFVADCKSDEISKACYICGELTHEERNCTQATSCYICKDVQHLARDCPEKGDCVCLRCGGRGHTYSSCWSDYNEADLKAMQCYVCKQFGHLCCFDGLESFPTELSCYICAGVGHSGMACTAKSRNESSANGKATPVCYRCEGEGHYARDCNRADEKTPKRGKTPKEKPACYKCGNEGHIARDCTRSDEKTPSQCYKCGLGGHFARDCSQSNQADQQCFKCGQGGHFARDCSANQATNVDEKCYKCGREGHFARDCKKRWNSEADNDHSRRGKTPRLQEQFKEQKHYTPKTTNQWRKPKPKPSAELVRESSGKKLPKWHEIER